MDNTASASARADGRPVGTGDIVSAGSAAAVVAVAVNVALAIGIVSVLHGADGYDPLAVPAVIVTTLVAIAGSAVLLALLRRWTARPIRLFRVLVVVGTLISLGGPLSLLQEPKQYPQATPSVVAWTALLHLTTAAVVLVVLPRVLRGGR